MDVSGTGRYFSCSITVNSLQYMPQMGVLLFHLGSLLIWHLHRPDKKVWKVQSFTFVRCSHFVHFSVRQHRKTHYSCYASTFITQYDMRKK